MLHELLPKARVMALLVDPTDPTNAKTTVSEVTAAAKTFGLQLHVLNASNENDFAGVFAKLIQLGASGLVVGGGAFFVSHEEQLAALTVRHAVPAASEHREFAAAGGLLSYGTDITDAYRLTGIYTGPPMTLANMREQGVRSLSLTCELCHHAATMNVDRFADTIAVPGFGPRMVCTSWHYRCIRSAQLAGASCARELHRPAMADEWPRRESGLPSDRWGNRPRACG